MGLPDRYSIGENYLAHTGNCMRHYSEVILREIIGTVYV